MYIVCVHVTWAREWGMEYYTLLFTCNIVKWYHICLNKGHLINIWNLKKSSILLHMSISLFFKVNRHETFQIFGRPDFLVSKCRITCFCLKIVKMTFLERVTGFFRFFYLESSFLISPHTWKYWYVCSDEYGINCKYSVVFASLLKMGCWVVLKRIKYFLEKNKTKKNKTC